MLVRTHFSASRCALLIFRGFNYKKEGTMILYHSRGQISSPTIKIEGIRLCLFVPLW